MIPKECKRLAEVDFPIAAVSKHSAREKSIRHGHPSTLHLWWARRPLAACRSMLMALLLPDPCDPHCPPRFIEAARRILLEFPGAPQRWHGALADNKAKGKSEKEKTLRDGSLLLPFSFELLHSMRSIVLEFIADFANWDNSAKPAYLNTARALVKAAHGDEPPLVVDPFAGGGSIPLEALRIGCDAFASDLNPVACLINKVLLEDIPRHGPELAEELRRVGAEINKQAEMELAEFYPADPDGARPIAYLWARTVRCEQPSCGCEIPLVRSFWLCKKGARGTALQYEVVSQMGGAPRLDFKLVTPHKADEVQPGTVSRAKATCPACHRVLAPNRVRAQLRESHGGADAQLDARGHRVGGARLLALVLLRPEERGRTYRLAQEADYAALARAVRTARQLDASEFPIEPLPSTNTNCFRIPNYGMSKWTEVSSIRQKVALRLLGKKVLVARDDGIRDALALAASRCTDFNSSLNSWASKGEFVRGTFARQALSMVWDFCETMPVTTESGGYSGALDWVARVVESHTNAISRPGQIQAADACESPLPSESASVWFTDPPYYDAVGYAELSDFFYVWLKRARPGHRLLRDPYDPENPLVPKSRECVQDESYKSVAGLPKDRAFFESTMARAFSEGRRVSRADSIGCIVFAHKTTEGWEALLTGMIRGGWVITGSWPIATERPGRLRSQESAALATSVHLICRPRPDDAPVGDWGDVLRELPRRVVDWMDRLQGEGVRGADLVFACIGPALEIYSRYSKVVDAQEREIPLGGDPEARDPHKRGYLAYVWEVVGRTALQQVLGNAEGHARNGAAGALEEDARLTALFLWTMQSTEAQNDATNGEAAEDDEAEDEEEDTAPKSKKKGFSLIYDVARRFAQPLGIHLETWENRIIETDKGVVRLLPVLERAEQLFGEEGASAVADRLERGSGTAAAQLELFPQPRKKEKGKRKKKTMGAIDDRESDLSPFSFELLPSTTLDRVHAAMLLQAGGRANALRALLKAEVDRGPDFLRLANALSALYPQGSDEKRLLDAMLLAVPR